MSLDEILADFSVARDYPMLAYEEAKKTTKQAIYKDLEIIIGTSANLDGSTDTGLLYKKVKKYCE